MAIQGSGQPPHMRGKHSFPYGGTIMHRSDIAKAHYDPANDTFVISYMGQHHEFDGHLATIDRARFEYEVTYWLDYIHSTHHQPKGQSHVSGQSNQGASGGSLGALSGSGGGGGLTSQQAQQQIALANLAANQLSQYHQSLLQSQFGNHGGGHTRYLPLATWVGGSEDNYVRPEPLKPDGLKLGEIIGWRGWRITTEGFLHSMSADVLWAPGEPMYGNVRASIDHNGCYAYKNARDFLKKHADGLAIYGKVAMWGRVIEHELGYRAEWAKIVSLEEMLKPQRDITLAELRERYGV